MHRENARQYRDKVFAKKVSRFLIEHYLNNEQ